MQDLLATSLPMLGELGDCFEHATQHLAKPVDVKQVKCRINNKGPPVYRDMNIGHSGVHVGVVHPHPVKGYEGNSTQEEGSYHGY